MTLRSTQIGKLMAGWLIPLSLFGFQVWYGLHWFDVGINMFDTGFQVYGADRVARGAVLYRDVFTLYTPGIYYATALAFKVFGTKVVVYHALMMVCVAASSALSYMVARYLMPTLFAFFLGFFFPFYYLPNWGIFFALLCLLLIFVYSQRCQRYWLFAAGLATGMSILFKQEVGAYVTVAECLFITVQITKFTPVADRLRRDKVIELAKAFGLFGLGLVTLLIPTVVYFWSQSALGDMYYFLVPKANSQIHHTALPFPSLVPLLPQSLSGEEINEWLGRVEFYAPLLVYLLTTIFILARISRKNLSLLDLQLVAVLLFGVLLFNSALVRSDHPHLVFSVPPAHILTWCLLYLAVRYLCRHPRRALESGMALLLLAALFLFEYRPLMASYKALHNLPGARLKTSLTYLDMPRLGLYLGHEDAEFLEQVTKDVITSTDSGEKIFVFPSVAPIIYFLSQRDNPTRYDWIIGGVLDEDEQREVIDVLEEAGVEYVVFYSTRGLEETRAYAQELDSGLIYDYIVENYEVEMVAPRYQMLRLAK